MSWRYPHIILFLTIKTNEMKKVTFLLFSLIIFLATILPAQTDDQAKLDNLNYYLSSIKDYSQSMRYYTDSTKILSLLDQLDNISSLLQEELNNIVIPSEQPIEPVLQDTTTWPTEQPSETLDNNPWNTGDVKDSDNDEGGIGVSKFMPFKNKSNTNFKISFGINSLFKGADVPSSILEPEINTAGSWYWDFALTRRARIGGKDSKVAINYGISFLKNRFKIENDLRLISNLAKNPEFVAVPEAKSNPKLNVGYINVPLNIHFALSKKTKLELGGYAGYRIHTVQKFQLKTSQETIHENRYAGYNLNNWIYGTTASLDISGFDIIFRYTFSKLFKDNPNYDYNTFMIGTSFSLF